MRHLRLFAAGAVAAFISLGGTHAVSAGLIQATPGAFTYSYVSQNGTDPNATLLTNPTPPAGQAGSTPAFVREATTPFSTYYDVVDGTSGLVTYTFNAPAGGTFTGNAAIHTQLGLFEGGTGNVQLTLLNGTTNPTVFTSASSGSEVARDDTVSVNGLSTFTLQYAINNAPGGSNGAIGIQLFRQNGTTSFNTTPFTVAVTSTPEPASVGLLGLGGLVILRRRRS